MEKEEQIDTTETEDDLKKRKLTRPSDDAMFLRKEITKKIRWKDGKLLKEDPEGDDNRYWYVE